jgi:hypothetical protein
MYSPRCTRLMVGDKSSKIPHEMILHLRKEPKRAGNVPVMESTRRSGRAPRRRWPTQLAPLGQTRPGADGEQLFPLFRLRALTSRALSLHKTFGNNKGVFTSHANPKYFFFHPSHRIFGRMHGVLNVVKKR